MTYQTTIEALADPTRRAIFEDLRKGPCAVTDIAKSQTVSRPAVSQHLKVLASAGLVAARQKGTRRYYSIRREGLSELKEWVEGFWTDVLENYAAHVQNEIRENDD
ncbi:MAG: ArsR/SmtB family transcription factor [Rhizobiaceae bacterium]